MAIEKVALNYFNLKQEFWFRNILLEQLNEEFGKNDKPNFRALAEHPRINGKRVDLSIVDSNNLDSPYLIELKFQYSGDFSQHKKTKELIEKDFILRGSNMFILIVLDFKTQIQNEIDESWGIQNGISKYISKNNDWSENLAKSFSEYADLYNLFETEHIIEIDKMEYFYKILVLSKVD